MAKRSLVREIALQLLFQQDFNPKVDERRVRQFLAESYPGQSDVHEMALEMYRGVTEHLNEIDERIARAARNWSLERMSAVDRNIVRLGCFELFYYGSPSPVVINEAINLAKRYGSSESAAFVNGLLDRIRREFAATHAEPPKQRSPE